MPTDFVRRLRLPTYLLVAFLSVGSLIEVLTASWPIHVHNVDWRISALNSAAGATGTVLLALLILLVVSQLGAAEGALWTGFAGAIVFAVAYVAAAGTFILDSLQLRGRIAADQLNRFDITIAWAL